MTNKKVVKRTRKVDNKAAAKDKLSKMFQEFLEAEGVTFDNDHADFGFTKGTLVVDMGEVDVQVKLITPKAGVERYHKVVYVTEEEYEEMIENGEIEEDKEGEPQQEEEKEE